MKVAAPLFVVAIAFGGALAAQEDSSNGDLAIIGIEALESNQVEWAYTPSTTSELSDDARTAAPSTLSDRARASRSRASFVDTVSIRPFLLQPSAAPGTQGPVVGAVPPNIHHVALTISGQRYVLDVIESQYDQQFSLRHVTAVVVSHPPDAYALFTVDDAAGLIAGTIRTGEQTYRIVPSERAGTQMVFALDEEQGGQTVPSRYLPVTGSDRNNAESIERRHLQAEVLAEIRPSLYSDDGLVVTLDAGRQSQDRLGYISRQEVVDPNAIARLLARLGPLTGAQGEEEFEIVSVSYPQENSEGVFTVLYRQVIAGMAVGVPRELIVGADGDVLRLTSALIDPASLPDITLRLTDAEALSTAVEALKIEFGAAGNFEYEQFEEKADTAFRIIDGAWAPIWRSLFSVSSNSSSGSYWVSVNVVTGETTIASSDFH